MTKNRPIQTTSRRPVERDRDRRDRLAVGEGLDGEDPAEQEQEREEATVTCRAWNRWRVEDGAVGVTGEGDVLADQVTVLEDLADDEDAPRTNVR